MSTPTSPSTPLEPQIQPPTHARVPGASSGSSQIGVAASVVVVVAALYFAREVLIPIALAVFLSFLLAPLVMRLQRMRIGRTPAVILTALFSFSLIGGVTWVVATQVVDLAGKLPSYEDNIRAKMALIQKQRSGPLSRLEATFLDLKNEWSRNAARVSGGSSPANSRAATPDGGPKPQAVVPSSPDQKTAPAASDRTSLPEAAPATAAAESKSSITHGVVRAPSAKDGPITVEVERTSSDVFALIRSILGPLVDPLATSVIVIVFVIFMLVHREDLRDRLIRLAGRGQLSVTTEALNDATMRISKYLKMLTIINSMVGLIIGIGLAFIGIPNAALWGLLAAVLRFVPYVGPWIAAAMPLVLSLAVSKGFLQPGLTLALYAIVEISAGNIVEPLLYGSGTGLSPLAILTAAIFWAWLWGPIGLILATPLTLCTVVIGRHVPQLEFLHILLGDNPPLPPEVHFYQRLLAYDSEEALEFINAALKEKSVLDVEDSILLPTLRIAEGDREKGTVTEDRHHFIIESVRTISDDLAQRRATASEAFNQGPATPDKGTAPAPDPQTTGYQAGTPRILCLPASSDSDELAAHMLSTVLDARDIQSFTVRPGTRLREDEMLAEVKDQTAPAVCLSAFCPSSLIQARHLCVRLRKEFPSLTIFVCLWGLGKDNLKTRQQFERDGATRVVSSLSESATVLSRFASQFTKGIPQRA